MNQTPSARPLRVSELNRMLKRSVEAAASMVWVAGEISGAKAYGSSGHVYFTLKDEQTGDGIEAVAYRSIASRYGRDLRDGNRVVVRGNASVWTRRGKLQLVVDVVRPQGRGALLEQIERLKEQLRREGLFDQQRKQPVPEDAAVIGVVTSRAGAVIHDIIRVSFRRGNPRILLAPAVVQGEQAVSSLIHGLDMIERVRDVDVIIIGRGGGSFEDLLPFYDERLARRIAACSVPVVSAVGHEVDVTITDMVADARAATPSQAAEMVVADRQHVRKSLAHLQSRLTKAVRSYIAESSVAHERLVHRLGSPSDLINEHRQRVDELTQRAADAIRTSVQARTKIQTSLARRLAARHPRTVLVSQRSTLRDLNARLINATKGTIDRRRSSWQQQHAKLQAMSPLAVLERGYALVTTVDGGLLMDAASVRHGDDVHIRLRRGRLRTTVQQVRVDDEEG